jgi:hypothetical protein
MPLAGHIAVAGSEALSGLFGVEEEYDRVGFRETVQNSFLHPGAQGVARFLRAGGIDEDRLISRTITDAPDRTAGRLWSGGGDRNLLPHELVDQRALAHVGPTDYRDEAALQAVLAYHRSSGPKELGRICSKG